MFGYQYVPPFVQPAAAATPSQPPTSRRQLVSIIAASWLVVEAFNFVAPKAVPAAPPVIERVSFNATARAVVHQTWPPLTWDIPARQKLIQPGQGEASQVQRLKYTQAPIALWPQPDWPSQQTSKLVQPGQGEATQVQRLKFSQAPIPLWPQPEWASQTTRKVVQPGQGEATRVLFERLALQPAWQWPQGEWASQSTRKTPIPDAVTSVPFSRASANTRALWWDAQTTLPIWQPVSFQDGVAVVGAVPGKPASSQPIWSWESPIWQTHTTRKTPILAVNDTPPPRTIAPSSIAIWQPLDWPAQRVVPPSSAVAPANPVIGIRYGQDVLFSAPAWVQPAYQRFPYFQQPAASPVPGIRFASQLFDTPPPFVPARYQVFPYFITPAAANTVIPINVRRLEELQQEQRMVRPEYMVWQPFSSGVTPPVQGIYIPTFRSRRR